MNLTTIKASLVHLFTAGLLTAGLVTLGSCTTSETGNKNTKNAKNQYTEEEIAKFNNLTDIEVLMNTLSELDKIDNFYIKTTGKTTTKAGFIPYNQNTETTLYSINRNMYNNISSTSAFVNHYHTSYTIGNQVYFYDSEDKKTLKTTDLKYKETFGKLPTYSTVFNYIITEADIISSSRVVNADKLEFKFNLNTTTTTKELKKQMKVFGGLSSYPTFEVVMLTIVIDANFRLISFYNHEEYLTNKAPLGDIHCIQDLSSTTYYEDYELPDYKGFLKRANG